MWLCGVTSFPLTVAPYYTLGIMWLSTCSSHSGWVDCLGTSCPASILSLDIPTRLPSRGCMWLALGTYTHRAGVLSQVYVSWVNQVLDRLRCLQAGASHTPPPQRLLCHLLHTPAGHHPAFCICWSDWSKVTPHANLHLSHQWVWASLYMTHRLSDFLFWKWPFKTFAYLSLPISFLLLWDSIF